MRRQRARSVVGLVTLSVVATAGGTGVAYWLEQLVLPLMDSAGTEIAVGLIEEAFVRLVPLVVTFYVWSFHRGYLLSKTDGVIATVASGITVGLLEFVLKLQFLTQFERAVRFDFLVLPFLFLHLPLALIAGRFVYALGREIHGMESFESPSISKRTLAVLVGGYLALTGVHAVYNGLVVT